ncbi:MAG: polysaccharide deacetylase family protein [Anaerolineae bacterium]|nr:polysaccharide deacetylase family protein [Anaerolineae bacterium]
MAWAGEIPSTQDYIINAVSVSGSPTVYTLQVEFVTEVTSSPTPKPTDTPVPTRAPTDTPAPAPAATSGPAAKAKDNVVYLTFDDGPTDPRWTPQVLAVLAQHNAHVTFFVLGQQAEKYPKLIETQVAAGHTVANHTNSHVSLDGISREKFFEEVSATKDVLEERESKCLRPPYGATDAYTRAYAEELGYRIVMWDIDTEDWKRPGAESIAARVLKNVFPGAIILFHDGGGDRAQTVEALATVLNELAKQGYRFEPVC